VAVFGDRFKLMMAQSLSGSWMGVPCTALTSQGALVFIAMLLILLERFGEGTTSVLLTSAMGFTIALACSEMLKDWFAGAMVLSASQYRAGKPRPFGFHSLRKVSYALARAATTDFSAGYLHPVGWKRMLTSDTARRSWHITLPSLSPNTPRPLIEPVEKMWCVFVGWCRR
jgi:hypothetical protein